MTKIAIKATSIAFFLIILFFVGYMLVEPLRQIVYGEASYLDTDMFFGVYPVAKWLQSLIGLVLIILLVKFGFGRLFR